MSNNVLEFTLRQPAKTDIAREHIARDGIRPKVEVVGDNYGAGSQDDWVIVEVLTQRRHVADVCGATWSIIG